MPIMSSANEPCRLGGHFIWEEDRLWDMSKVEALWHEVWDQETSTLTRKGPFPRSSRIPNSSTYTNNPMKGALLQLLHAGRIPLPRHVDDEQDDKHRQEKGHAPRDDFMKRDVLGVSIGLGARLRGPRRGGQGGFAFVLRPGELGLKRWLGERPGQIKPLCGTFATDAKQTGKKERSNTLNIAIENMCKKTRDLRRQLRKAIIDHVSDSFLDTTVPLLVLIEAAKNGREKEIKEYAAIFREHTSRLVEAMYPSVWKSIYSHPISHLVQVMMVAPPDNRMLKIINAALALAARPKSQVVKKTMEMYKRTWENHIHVLTEAVDDITSIDDFLAVSVRSFGYKSFQLACDCGVCAQRDTVLASVSAQVRAAGLAGKSMVQKGFDAGQPCTQRILHKCYTEPLTQSRNDLFLSLIYCLGILKLCYEAKMTQLPEAEKEKIAEQVADFKKVKSKLDAEIEIWDDTSNDIIVLAKKMCMIMMEMTDFTRGKGPLKHTTDVIYAAKMISESGSRMDVLARQIANQCPDPSCKQDLLAYLEQIKFYSHQLKICSQVKAEIQNLGGELIMSALDSVTSLIQAAKNLMNAVVQTVKMSYIASTKIIRIQSPTGPRHPVRKPLRQHWKSTTGFWNISILPLEAYRITASPIHQPITMGFDSGKNAFCLCSEEIKEEEIKKKIYLSFLEGGAPTVGGSIRAYKHRNGTGCRNV
ncbi:CTNNA3, partial [Cervus elaphus hippelaphus]